MFGIDDALIGTVAGGLMTNLFAGSRQEDQQAFNAQQQAIAQQYNSAEAATNRDFQERMSNTANQRAVADLKAAGLNPMLSLMQHGASTPSGGQAGVSATSSGIASPANEFNFTAAMQTASQVELNRENTNKAKAETDRTQAEADEIRARTPTHAVNIEKTQQDIKESIAQVGKILQDTSTSAYSAANLAQQTKNLQELIPQIRATVEQLQAHTRLAGAQTTLAGAQTGLAKAETQSAVATTGRTVTETGEIQQRIKANLPRLEAALKELERQKELRDQPRQMQQESVHDSYIGSLSATMQALNPFANIIPTIGIRGTGAPTPQPGRKDWKK